MTALTISGIGPTVDDSTGALTVGAGGIALSTLAKYSNIPIGSVAYGSLGTDGVHVAGTIYVSELMLDYSKSVTGIAVLNGTTAGTDELILGLYNSSGVLVANTALAGVTASGTDAFQEIDLTSVYAAPAGKYFVLLQCNGTTTKTRKIAASTYLNLAASATGTFGTLPALTVPTSFTADKGPIVYLY